MSSTNFTRRQFEMQAREKYREATLSLLTARWKYAALAFGCVLANGLALFLVRASGMALVLSAVITGLGLFIALRWAIYDREIRMRAQLTPVYDIMALRGQVEALSVAIDILDKAGDAAIPTREAVNIVGAALTPILSRAPDLVADLEAPAATLGSHVAAIKTARDRLSAVAAEDGAFAETVVTIANDIAPRLNSIAAIAA